MFLPSPGKVFVEGDEIAGNFIKSYVVNGTFEMCLQFADDNNN